MSSPFAKFELENRRCAILRVLQESSAYRANDSLIHQVIESLGFGCTRDQVHTDLRWLEEQTLLAIEELGGVLIATATDRGVDVALGRAMVPGVKRPRPGNG